MNNQNYKGQITDEKASNPAVYTHCRSWYNLPRIDAALVAAVISALTVGSADISLSRVLAAFLDEDKTARVIVVGLRLPRLAGAALAGAALATAGQLLQAVTDNELCAPNIIGVNSGSGLAVMLVLCLFPMYWQLLPLAAFIGALAASFFVLLVSGASPGDQKSSLILAGVALSSILGAGISFLSLKYPDVLSSYTAFSVGGFSGVTFDELAIPAIMIFVCFILAMIAAPQINLLCLGDEAAGSLGVRVRRLRVATIVITSGLCAAAVSFAGLLGFVGLIVPHIIRRICGQRLRRILPITGAGRSFARSVLGCNRSDDTRAGRAASRYNNGANRRALLFVSACEEETT